MSKSVQIVHCISCIGYLIVRSVNACWLFVIDYRLEEVRSEPQCKYLTESLLDK